MIRRDLLLTGASALGAAVATGKAFAQEGGVSSQQTGSFDVIRDWGFTPPTMAQDGMIARPTGSLPPRQSEIRRAAEIQATAPRGEQPIDIAKWFAALKDVNDDGDPYIYEWPIKGRANPLIVGFFASTFTIPSQGDQTSWCAAFVNYCLMLGRRAMTESALSGSFRQHKSFAPTNSPQLGDIVVFRDRGQKGDLGFGHVAFYISRTDSSVTTLGGNQRGGTGSTGAITQATFPLNNDDFPLKLVGYRKIA